MMETKKIFNLLINEFDLSPKAAQIVVEKLETVNPTIKVAIDQFLESGVLTNLEIEEYTVQRLIKEHGMNPFAAMLTLDWLIREPNEAKKSLKKGHDWVKK